MGYWRRKEQNTEERDLPPLTGIMLLSPEFFVYIEVNREQHSTSILLDGMEKPSQFNIFWHILVFLSFTPSPGSKTEQCIPQASPSITIQKC